jgi:hypothetical protein
MNLAEIEELKEKLIKCDKTIHIQQLGMQWNPPASLEKTITADQTRGSQIILFIKAKIY